MHRALSHFNSSDLVIDKNKGFLNFLWLHQDLKSYPEQICICELNPITMPETQHQPRFKSPFPSLGYCKSLKKGEKKNNYLELNSSLKDLLWLPSVFWKRGTTLLSSAAPSDGFYQSFIQIRRCKKAAWQILLNKIWHLSGMSRPHIPKN